MKRSFKDSVAVITGAGSGMGRTLALQLAAEGANLALSDINLDSVRETESMIEDKTRKVRADQIDVTHKEAVFAYADDVEADFGRVNMVFNNAGAALNAPFTQMTVEDFEWQMNVNFWGVAYGTKAFLPILERAEWGHIVNTSSIFGIVAAPGCSAYNASKFAVRGMTEALRLELDAAGSSVSCTSIHPGGVKTNIVRLARTSQNNDFMDGKSREEAAAHFDKLALTTPEKAATIILKGVRKNRKRVLVGPDAVIVDKIQRIFPQAYQAVVGKYLS